MFSNNNNTLKFTKEHLGYRVCLVYRKRHQYLCYGKRYLSVRNMFDTKQSDVIRNSCWVH